MPVSNETPNYHLALITGLAALRLQKENTTCCYLKLADVFKKNITGDKNTQDDSSVDIDLRDHRYTYNYGHDITPYKSLVFALLRGWYMPVEMRSEQKPITEIFSDNFLQKNPNFKKMIDTSSGQLPVDFNGKAYSLEQLICAVIFKMKDLLNSFVVVDPYGRFETVFINPKLAELVIEYADAGLKWNWLSDEKAKALLIDCKGSANRTSPAFVKLEKYLKEHHLLELGMRKKNPLEAVDVMAIATTITLSVLPTNSSFSFFAGSSFGDRPRDFSNTSTPEKLPAIDLGEPVLIELA